MPIAKYNPQFGGKPGSAAKALEAMQTEYGPEKGTSVFYALKNKRKKQQARGHSAKADPGATSGGMGVSGV